MMAWRIVDRLRRRLAQSQYWLEQHIDGWGDETAFNATASSTASVDAHAPEHWLELVRNGAPWLLRSGHDNDADARQVTSVTAVPSEAVQSLTNDTESRQRSEDTAVWVRSDVSGFDVIGPAEQDMAPGALSDKAVRHYRIEQRSLGVTRPSYQQNAELESLKGRRSSAAEPAVVGTAELPAEEEVGPESAASWNMPDVEDESVDGQVSANRYLRHAEEESVGAIVAERRHFRHAESPPEVLRHSLAMGASVSGALTRRPSWPPLPDESGQPDVIDDPWPALAFEISSEGDEPLAQNEEGRQWSV